jgi:hypothetical protein
LGAKEPHAHAQRLYREGLCRDGCRGRNNYNSVGSRPGQWRVAEDTVLNVRRASRARITVQRRVVAQPGIAELQSEPCAAGGHIARGDQSPCEYCQQQDPN